MVTFSSIFKNLSINWEKYVFHFDKWNFELAGYSAHITDYLVLVKVLLTYIWRWLAKYSSSSFYSACGDRGLKQIRKIFQISSHVSSLLGQTEGKRKAFFQRDRGGWCKVRLPQIALSLFKRLKKFLLLWNLSNPTPSFVDF